MLTRRTVLQTLLVPLAGCLTRSGQATTTLSNTSHEPPSPTLAARLGARRVTDDDFVRTVLYTWTTTRQVDDLRATGRLLVATASSGTFVSPFNRSLPVTGASSGTHAAVARVLATHPSLIRRRYAWPSAYATVLGFGRGGYGSALLRIELRPDAWIGRYDPMAPEPFRFVETGGGTIANDQVLATPERIGAIFHVRTESTLAAPFREYVVTNPGMVASWSVATDEIHAELERERALVRAMQDHRRDDEVDTAWRASLASGCAHYQPRPRRLSAIVAALERHDAAGPPLAVRL